MEQSSKDVIARFFEAYAVRDWAALREATTDDVRWHFPGRHPLAGTRWPAPRKASAR